MNSKELLQLQLSAKRSKPKGVKPDIQNGITYYAELRRMVQAISKDINQHIMPVVRNLAPEYARDGAIETNDSWVDILTAAMNYVKNKWTGPQFKLFADATASKFVLTANRSNRARTERDLGINIYADNQTLTDYLQASVVDNVRLISSIPEQYLTQVESIVFTNARAGGRPAAIAKALQQQLGVTERRAKLIARDQSNKINADLSSMRIKNAGFEYFKWETSHDERVRDRHEEVSKRVTAYGKGIYKFSNPPIVDQNIPQLPGEPIQCRCIMIPISQAEVDENVKKGLTNPAVKH